MSNDNRAVGSLRFGATLVEVLMSLLIMSIGIVSVIALFPVAILSSIKATQLTNAKLLEENVVELLRANPQFVTGTKIWQPLTSYSAGQFVTVPPAPGEVLPTNGIFFQCAAAGTSGATAPVWPRVVGGTVNEGSVSWSANGTLQYAIDPIGRSITSNANLGTTSCQRLDLTSPNMLGTTVNALKPSFSLPDSWGVVSTAVPVSVAATSVTFGNEISLSDLVADVFRVTVRSADGTASATRVVSSVAGQVVNLQGANLPASIVNAFSDARIESFNPRYSWILTVKRTSPTARPAIQCAVYFNRSYGTDEEDAHAYTATGQDSLNVTFTGTPLVSEGKYAFDVNNCSWHKIVSVNGTTVVLDTPSYTTGNTGNIMFPPNVIRVFDIEL